MRLLVCAAVQGAPLLRRFACLLLVSASIGAAALDANTSRLYEDALQRFDRKDYAGAIVQLKNVLQIDRSFLPVHVLMGKALLAQGQPIPAEAALVEALRLGASREEVVVPLGRATLDTGKPRHLLDDERFAETDLSRSTRFELLVLKAGAADDVGERKLALQLLEKARAIDPSSAETWLSEARLGVRAGQLKEALAAADKAIALAPGQAAPLYVRGTVAHTQGDLKGALSFYDRALQAAPENVDALVSRGGLLLDLNRPADAARDVQALLKVDPNEARGVYLSALLAERAGRADEAKAALAKVTAQLDTIPIAMLRYRPQLLMLGGLAHFGLNGTEKAKPYLEGVLRDQPGSPAAKLMARIHLNEGNIERATEAMEAYTRLHPRDPQATLLLATAHMAQGRHQRAVTLLQAALQHGQRPELQQALGAALMKAGQFKEALAELEAAYKRNPKSAAAGTSLAALYLQLGQPAKAVQVAEQLNKGRAEQSGLQFLLGRARLEAGDLKGARAPLETAARLEPKFLDPQIELARLELQSGAVDAAKARLNAAFGRDPKHVGLLALMGRVMAAEGHAAEAQRWFERADDHAGPNVIDHGLWLVEFHLGQGQLDRAREAMRRVTAKLPDSPRALVMQARIELAAGDRRAARSVLSRASNAVSIDAGALVAIAELQLAADDAPGAAHSAAKALKSMPQHVGAQVVSARTDIQQGSLPAAEQRAREIVRRLPKAGIGHSLLGEIAVARGQDVAATAELRRAYELDKNRSTLLQLFAQLARTRPAEAVREAEQWLKNHPDDAIVWRSLADAQARAGTWPAARKSYESALKLHPDDPETLNNLAHVLVAQSDPSALKVAERAHSLNPSAAHIVGTLGWTAHKAGQHERALQHLRDARLRSPDSAETRYYLGATLAALGRNGEARAELTAAVKSGRPFNGQEAARALLNTLN